MKFVLILIFIIATTSALATNQVAEPNRIDNPESGYYSQDDIQKANAEWQAERDGLNADVVQFEKVFGASPQPQKEDNQGQPPPCPEDGCG